MLKRIFSCPRRAVSLTARLRFNNYQHLNSDSLPARSYINSLFCQQMDFDWFVPYPTLPSQHITDIILGENSVYQKNLDGDDSLQDWLGFKNLKRIKITFVNEVPEIESLIKNKQITIKPFKSF